MFITLALVATIAVAQPNLDFNTGKFTHWENEGFRLSKGQVSSSDKDGKGKTGQLERLVRVPTNAKQIRCAAAHYRPNGVKAGDTLDVVVQGEDDTPLPCQVFDGAGWKRVSNLQPPDDGALREYAWDVTRLRGKRIRIAIVDADDRPRCYVVSTGFEFLTTDDVNARAFATAVRRIEKSKNLPRMLRYDSKHFMALSNAAAAQTEYRLYNCETLYSAFLTHFRKAGFTVNTPEEQLMVAVFSTQEGFESYVGQSYGSAVTGMYHATTNRLLVYDYGTNKDFVDSMKKLEELAQKGSADLEKQKKIITFGKWVRDRKDDINLSTMMHEAAHQMCFNTGLLNRDGDVPLWLAEGMATYCEPTAKGDWLGIGASNNSLRLPVLDPAVKGIRDFLPLKDLVRNDDWLRKAKGTDDVLLGYAQSWALVRQLMQEKPKAMKKYLAMIHPRRTDDHRLADFGSCFGTDLGALERSHREYVRSLVQAQTIK